MKSLLLVLACAMGLVMFSTGCREKSIEEKVDEAIRDAQTDAFRRMNQ